MWLKPRLKKSSHAFLLHLVLHWCHENMPRPAYTRKDPFQFSQEKQSLLSPWPGDMWTSLTNLNNSALRDKAVTDTQASTDQPRESRPEQMNCIDSQTKWFIYCCMIMMMLIAQSCPTLCDLRDCSPPGPSVHGILQARIQEWAVIHFSRGSSQPGVKLSSCVAGRFFTIWATRETPYCCLPLGFYGCYSIWQYKQITDIPTS